MIAYQVRDPLLSQYTYLVAADDSDAAIVIDPECDIERYEEEAARHGLHIVAVFETHVHSDFLSGLRGFAERGIPVYASDAAAPSLRYEWLLDSTYTYHLLTDGDAVTVGGLTVEAMHTPGHTPEHLCYLLYEDDTAQPLAVATGDFLFVGGTGCLQTNGDAGPEAHDASAHRAGGGSPLGPPGPTADAETSAGTPDAAAPDDAAPPSYAESGIAPALVQRIRRLPSSTHVWPLHSAGTLCGYAPSNWPVSTVWRECKTNPFLSDAPPDAPDHAIRGAPTPPPYFARIRKRNRTDPPTACTPPDPPWLSPEALAACLTEEDNVFLDIHASPSVFADGHLLGALHLPYTEAFLRLAGTYVPPKATLYLIVDDDHAEDPSFILQALARIGLTSVEGLFPRRLLTSLPPWTRVRLPTVRDAYLMGLAQHPGVMLLDVRMPAEYTCEHVPGSVNVPYTQLPRSTQAVPDDAIVIVHGGSEAETTAAAAYLQRQGYDVGRAVARPRVAVQE